MISVYLLLDSVISKIISYFNFSICFWVSPEYFMIRLMSTPSASIFLAISRAFWFIVRLKKKLRP